MSTYTAYVCSDDGDRTKPKKPHSQGFAVRARKKNSDSTLLYGAVRTDAVITAKTKKAYS